jgi:hypothetical protein
MAGHLSGNDRATRCPTGEARRADNASKPRQAYGVNQQSRCDQIEGSKNSTHGQKIALTAILDETDNFNHSRHGQTGHPANSVETLFLHAIARSPSHPREGDDWVCNDPRYR